MALNTFKCLLRKMSNYFFKILKSNSNGLLNSIWVIIDEVNFKFNGLIIEEIKENTQLKNEFQRFKPSRDGLNGFGKICPQEIRKFIISQRTILRYCQN